MNAIWLILGILFFPFAAVGFVLGCAWRAFYRGFTLTWWKS